MCGNHTLHEMKSEIRPFLRKVAEVQKAQMPPRRSVGGRKPCGRRKAAYRRNLAEKKNSRKPFLCLHGPTVEVQRPLHKSNQGASVKGSPAPRSGQPSPKAPHVMRIQRTSHTAPSDTIITRRARTAALRKAQRAMLQDSVKNGGNAAKKLGGTAVQAIKAVGGVSHLRSAPSCRQAAVRWCWCCS